MGTSGMLPPKSCTESTSPAQELRAAAATPSVSSLSSACTKSRHRAEPTVLAEASHVYPPSSSMAKEGELCKEEADSWKSNGRPGAREWPKEPLDCPSFAAQHKVTSQVCPCVTPA